jgi:hypothetical protein
MSKSKDLFKLVVSPEKLHPNFLKITPQPNEEDYHGPTRLALQESFDKLPKPDGNFIKDFQSTGFDSRVWELYLNETFRSVGLEVKQPFDRPEFLLSNGQDEVWVEAVTANASQVFTEDDSAAELWDEQDEVAIKLGGPLRDKLKKKYWELQHVSGKPLVLAIADFHDTSPGLRNSSHALERYAYGSQTEKMLCSPDEVPLYRFLRARAMEQWLQAMNEQRQQMETQVVAAHRARGLARRRFAERHGPLRPAGRYGLLHRRIWP